MTNLPDSNSIKDTILLVWPLNVFIHENLFLFLILDPYFFSVEVIFLFLKISFLLESIEDKLF